VSIDVRLAREPRRQIQRVLVKTKSRIKALHAPVKLLHKRESVTEVARGMGCVRATVYRAVYRFVELGGGGLADRRDCSEFCVTAYY
jgi:hypothetical protein